MNLRSYKTIKDRRVALENNLSVKLASIGSFTTSQDIASSQNCENMIGFVTIPLGVAGPLRIKHPESKPQDYYIPLATTEGALVASVNRGCKAITESGGAKAVSKKVGITRAPVFVVDGITQGFAFIEWIEKHMDQIKKTAESTSSHLRLLDIKPWMSGRNVYLRFYFDSFDAMGMNMATNAVAHVTEFIAQNTHVSCVSISGNMCSDKKPNFLNFIEGRGHKVWAEVVIPDVIVRKLLKASAHEIFEVAQRKLMYGSVIAGTIGTNAHFANILAALFLATGQDVAHVAECSMGVTGVETIKTDLYVSVYLPDLVVGAVGGGTKLATQKEALSILGIQGGNGGKNAAKLAEIIGACVLAGEISLLSSLSEGTLGSAHNKLARGK